MYLDTSTDPSGAVDAEIPPGACVTSDEPDLAITANRFVPSASACPAIVDPFGMWMVRNHEQLPGSPPPISPSFVADWRSWLQRSNFVMLSVQLSDYIPWTPALIQWFDQQFVLISSQPHTFVYRNVSYTPSVVVPSGSATQLVTAGLVAERAGNMNQAFTDYQEALAKDPSNIFALYDLGHINQERGHTEAAAKQYLAVLRIDPKFDDALYNMGVLEAPFDPKGAIGYYTQDLRIQPTNAAANFNLGVLLIDHGKTAQGYSYLEVGLRLNPALSADVPSGINVPASTTTTTGGS
jgi:hypothetical protein